MTPASRSAVLSIALGTIALTGCGDTTTGNDARAIEAIDGFATADTVHSIPDPIVVRVTDGDGSPVIGANVEFLVLPRTDGTYGGYFTISTDNTYQSIRPTEEGGIVLGHIGFMGGAGPVDVRIRVQNSSLEAIAHLTSLPGNAVRVAPFPFDSAVYAGATLPLRGAVLDVHGNRRSEPVTYQALTPDIAITGGSLTAGQISRNSYIVSGAGFTDTGFVSIVPQGTIAFVSALPDSVGLVSVNLNGSGYQWIKAIDPNVVLTPVYNPAGTALYVSVTKFTIPLLHRLDVPGNGVFQSVTPGNLEGEMWPAVSPDGNYVYFSGWTPNRNPSLWRVKTNGDSAIQVGQLTGLYGSAHVEWRSTVSPDGSQLAFVTRDAGGTTAIKTMTIATKTYSSWSVGPAQTPAWSPVADQIVYVVEGGGGIRMVNGDGSNDHQISEPGRVYAESRPSWSPDGAWIVARGEVYLELINVQTGLTLPLGLSGVNHSPTWRP